MNKLKKPVSILLTLLLLLSAAVAAPVSVSAEPETRTIQFTNVQNWSEVYVCTYKTIEGSDTVVGDAWPGTQMSLKETNGSGQSVYEAQIGRDATYVVFSENGNSQSPNLALQDWIKGYYYDDNSASYKVTTYFTLSGGTITGYSGPGGEVTIPSVINGQSVTGIGSRAFEGKTSITSLTIPGSITTVGDYAFNGCSGIKSLKIIGRNLTGINYYNRIFQGCSGITDLTIDGLYSKSDSMRYFVKSAYVNVLKQIQTLTVTGNSVNNAAFTDCSNLREVTINKSINSIGDRAFACGSSLESVYYPGTLSEWNNISFSGSGFGEIYMADGGTRYSDSPHDLYLSGEKLTNLVIPENITAINPHVFAFTKIESLTLHNGVKSIGEGAFAGCPNLPEVTIPLSVEEMDAQSFGKCQKLKSVYYPGDFAAWSDIDFKGSAFGDIYRVNKTFSTEYDSPHDLYLNDEKITDLVIPVDVTEISPYAFTFSTITKITFNDNVITIGEGAFAGCAELSSVTIPDSVTTAGDFCFNKCLKLDGINIGSGLETISVAMFAAIGRTASHRLYVTPPDTVKTIDDEAFAASRAYNFDSGKGVEIIGDYAFFGCYIICDIKIQPNVLSVGDYAFYSCGYSNDGGMSVGAIFDGGNDHTMLSKVLEVFIYGADTTFGNNVFEGRTNIHDLTLNGEQINLKVYGSGFQATFDNNRVSFSNITNLNVIGTAIDKDFLKNVYTKEITNIDIADTVESIEAGAFDGCKADRTVTGTISIKLRGDADFDYNNLPSKSLISGLNIKGELVKDNIFKELPNLQRLVINDTVESIGNSSFDSCAKLVNIKFSGASTLKSIGNSAFRDCSSLDRVQTGNDYYVIPASVETIGDYAFAGCSNLSNLGLSENLTKLKEGVFSDCTRLYSMRIPEKVKSVEDYAFKNCTSLKEVKFPDGLEKIGDEAYYNCTALQDEVSVPKNVESIGTSAFEKCPGLKKGYVWGRDTVVGDKIFHDCPDITLYGYDSSATDTYAKDDGDIPFFPILKTNMGGSSYKDVPLTDFQTTENDSNGFGLNLDFYGNIELLGIQLKRDDYRKDIRFVSVINEGIVSEATLLHDVADYGYVVAKTNKNTTGTVGEANIQKIALGAPNTIAFSCRNTSNKISADYGIYNVSTKYKYVTLAINGVDRAQGFVVRFYLKTMSGRVYYANYLTEYSGLATNFNQIYEGENTVLFDEDWLSMPVLTSDSLGGDIDEEESDEPY